MALGFIKKIFSFGKDDKSAAPADVAPADVEVPAEAAVVLDPVTAEHLGDRLIVPDVINPQDFEAPGTEDIGEERREQAESVAEFNEMVDEEPAPEVIPPDEPGIEIGIDEAAAADEGAATQAEVVPLVGVERPADTELAIEDEPVEEVPPAIEAEAASEGPQVDLPNEDMTQPEALSIDAARDASAEVAAAEDPPEIPVSEPVAAVEEPRANPVLPAGFSSTSDRIAPEPVTPERKLSWIERLRQGLSRTSAQLTSQITSLFTKRKLDDETLQDLEDLLIQADLGVETALRITDTLASERYGKDVSGEDVSKIMASEITKVLAPVARPLELDLSHKPHVILVVGVNGTGKTTTIGKLAAKLTRSGLRVMLAAGDTFRAAAIEQLHIWATRTGADIVSSKLGADAAGLAYEAYEKAKESGHDVLIIDTAGRLQNKTELMAELEKIVRVLGRLDPDAPHTVLQTLDATTGQNALNQVEIFRNVAGVSGLIMTKLDGTARGGILVAISAKHKLPVCFIGVGEGVEDLEPFNAQDFAEAIAGIQNK